MTLPADTLKEILALRKDNGLEATEAAVMKALAGLKYKLEETPRYRKAGRSPLYLPGKFLTSKGTDPVTGEQETASPKPAGAERSTFVGNGKRSQGGSKVDALQFYKVLHGRQFPIKITRDEITGEVETQLPESIKRLDLQFGECPPNGEGIFITQTSPKVLVTMTLDKFIELTGLKA
jgi:hypothetical protein